MTIYLSLRNKILILVSTIMLVFLSILLTAQFIYVSRIQEQQHLELCKIQTNLFIHNIGQDMWDMNHSYVITAADNVLKQPSFIRLSVIDERNNVIVDKLGSSKTRESDTENIVAITEPIHFIHKGQSQKLGIVKIIFSRAELEAEHTNLMKIFILADIVAMAVYLIGFYYFSRQFFEPINKITSTMLSLAQGETGIEVPYLNKQDEIGNMARSIQTFKKTAVNVDKLIHEIHEREIIQEQLEIKTELAKTANKAKSLFLANMSHEIRTPLNGVISTAELLIEDQLTPRQRKYVEIIQGSGRLLLTLLNDLLDLSKIEAHKLEIHNEVYDLRNSIQVIYNLFTSAAEKKGIALKLDIQPGVPQWVWGDEHRFQQILSNLVGNAVKYTSDGRILVKVQTKNSPDSRDNIRNVYFEVIDSGMGIPAAAIDTLFIRFSQAHKTSAINGTGLGLAICQSLVDLMNGFIGVESQEGVGSNFWFLLPLQEVAQPEISPKEKGLVEASQKIGKFGCRVLLVEDVEVNRIVIGDMLEMLGCRVDTAIHGEDALNILAKDSAYDIILMDCNMPVMDGFEATKKIREIYGDQCPIIAVSAHVASEDIQHCIDVGMNGYIYKPVNKQSLSEAILKWVKVDGTNDAQNINSPDFPVSVATKESPFNVDILKEWHGRNPLLATKFIDLTLKDATPLSKDIVAAIQEENFAKIKEASHALKSVSAQIGGVELSAICLSLERASANQNLEEIKKYLDSFEQSYTEFSKEIDFFRKQNGL